MKQIPKIVSAISIALMAHSYLQAQFTLFGSVYKVAHDILYHKRNNTFSAIAASAQPTLQKPETSYISPLLENIQAVPELVEITVEMVPSETTSALPALVTPALEIPESIPEPVPPIAVQAAEPIPEPIATPTHEEDSKIPCIIQPADRTQSIMGRAVPLATIGVFIDGALAGTTTTNAHGEWIFDLGKLDDAIHTAYVIAILNNEISPNSITIHFTSDTSTKTCIYKEILDDPWIDFIIKKAHTQVVP